MTGTGGLPKQIRAIAPARSKRMLLLSAMAVMKHILAANSSLECSAAPTASGIVNALTGSLFESL
jgi:hypothetical protein